MMREASRFYVCSLARWEIPCGGVCRLARAPTLRGRKLSSLLPLNRKPACSPAPLLPPHFPTRARPCIAPTSFPLPLCRRQKLWPPPMPL